MCFFGWRWQHGSSRMSTTVKFLPKTCTSTKQSLKWQTAVVAERVGRENIVTDEKGNIGYLVFKTLDSFGNNYKEILRQWTRSQNGFARTVSLSICHCLIRANGRGKMSVGEIVRQFLSFVAEKERQRTTLQAQGIRKAKEREGGGQIWQIANRIHRRIYCNVSRVTGIKKLPLRKLCKRQESRSCVFIITCIVSSKGEKEKNLGCGHWICGVIKFNIACIAP